ncbi:M50 family metallopeptidase [Staphylococcus shinii]|uniref:M50 family metallopeptidase n=1 Tax=Staphylococcus shinii TaxID=2912228 RepID=UPI00298EDF9A|nr:M50 family metallopeptidase [Staphylococcus shinii]MDW8570324.1 M50 family metallopeptidase [Staphylococcus shinii]MDW8573769.1 M50 family metallopeptidase [Staphylococcus shinii]
MSYLQSFFSSVIQLNLYWVVFIALIYILIHSYRNKPINQILDIYLNYIPVLTHEFGHILFNKISGGKAKDLVIVSSPSERIETSQQGFAITQSKSRLGQAITTFGGYIMPPLMLFIGFWALDSQYPSLFIVAYLIIFIYFLILTSRKVLPIIIVILLFALLYFLFQSDNQLMMFYIVAITYHFILGVLLGEVIQSSWTIFKLTFSRQPTTWDGSTLKSLTYIPTFVFSVIWIAINLFTIYQLFHAYFTT